LPPTLDRYKVSSYFKNQSYHTLSSMLARRLVVFLITLLAAAEVPAALPKPFTAWYTLHTRGLTIGTMERRLEIGSDGQYRYRSESRATGLVALFRDDRILEESRWMLENHQIRPLEYSYSYRGSKRSRTIKMVFDWQRSTITDQDGDNTWHIPIVPGVLDKLVYQLRIMSDLQRGARQLEYRIADKGTIKTYRFAILGEEDLSTPLGRLRTIKIERRKANSKRKTTFWCAPILSYLPVRAEYMENDSHLISAMIEKITPRT
jgi:Protein of unknown function (DUF3108)